MKYRHIESFPDQGSASLGRRIQRHQLCVYGQHAVRPNLLRGGLLRPVSTHGSSLPAHLRDCHGPRASNRDAAAGRLRSGHGDDSHNHGEIVHLVRPSGALLPQDSNVLPHRADAHGQQSHENGDQGGKDTGGHHGLFLPMLGTVLHHQRGGPFHPLLCALAAVDNMAVARLHQLRVEPLPLRLPEPGLSEGLPGHPLLWQRAVRTAGELLLRTRPQRMLSHLSQWDIDGTKVNTQLRPHFGNISLSTLHLSLCVCMCENRKLHVKVDSGQLYYIHIFHNPKLVKTMTKHHSTPAVQGCVSHRHVRTCLCCPLCRILSAADP